MCERKISQEEYDARTAAQRNTEEYRAEYARLKAEYEEHDYVSTACHHGLHVRCRQSCKFCGVPCGCRCHKEEGEPNE